MVVVKMMEAKRKLLVGTYSAARAAARAILMEKKTPTTRMRSSFVGQEKKKNVNVKILMTQRKKKVWTSIHL